MHLDDQAVPSTALSVQPGYSSSGRLERVLRAQQRDAHGLLRAQAAAECLSAGALGKANILLRADVEHGDAVEPGKQVQHPAAFLHVDKCRSEFGLQGAKVTMFYDPEACVFADSWDDTPQGKTSLKATVT